MTCSSALTLTATTLVLLAHPVAAQDSNVSGETRTVTSLVDPSRVIQWSEALRIGSVSGDPPETSFGDVRDLSLNDQGTEVYVLDRMHSQVRVFDTEGGFRRQWGRSGEGPGEFREATSIAVARDTVIVSDGVSIHVFGTTGALLNSFPARVAARVAVPHDVQAHRDGWTVTMLEIVEGQQYWRTYGFHPRDSILKPWLHQRADRDLSIPLLNYDPTSAVVGRNRFVDAPTPAYELREVDGDGQLVARYRYQHDVVPLADDPAERYASHIRARCREQPSAACGNLDEVLTRMTEMPLPDHRPVVGRIVAGGNGMMMIERRDLAPNPLAPEEAEARIFDIVGSDGRWLGQSHFPPTFVPIVFKDQEVWGTVEDEFDVEYVVRFVR